MMTIERLFWFPLLAAALHIFEEFVWPGGFAAWYRWYRPDLAPTVTVRFLVTVNLALLFACVAIGVDGPSKFGAALFLTITSLLFGNGVFHLSATLRRKRYAPGLITGVLLYLPLAVVGYATVRRLHLASIGTAVVAAILGGSYQWVSWSIHGARAARRSQRIN